MNNYVKNKSLEVYVKSLPPKYTRVTMETCKKLHPKERIEIIEGWLAFPKQNLLFVGEPGTGKTCMCYGIVMQLLNTRFCLSGEFIHTTASHMDTSLLSALKSDNADFYQMKQYKEQKLLVIDDWIPEIICVGIFKTI